MNQLLLFGSAPRGTQASPLPVHNGTSTSVAAAESVRVHAGSLRAMVLDFIRSKGDVGATRAEIEDGLNMSGNTVRPRVKELQVAGLVRDTEATRLTPSGRKASVLIACDID